jgi:DNA polymerase (family 10)
VAISTDAHSLRGLEVMRHGVDQARRAWLGPAEVLNAKPLAELLAWLAAKRGRPGP